MDGKTWILGKDEPAEDAIAAVLTLLQKQGFEIKESAWHNPEPDVWSVDIRDSDCALCCASGKGASREQALASALGQYIQRLACNCIINNYYMGPAAADKHFYHHPLEQWFPAENHWPKGLIDEPSLQALYNPEGALTPSQLVDTHSGDTARGVCALPYLRLSDGKKQWFPINLIGNLYTSNGAAAGYSREQARTRALTELLECHVKSQVISEGIALPEIPAQVLARLPAAVETISALRALGYAVQLRDASLGGKYPVLNVTLLNPENGSCITRFGAHPRFAAALQETLDDLLQSASLEQLPAFSEPSFDRDTVANHTNLESHFANASAMLPWAFFSAEPEYEFANWDFAAEIETEYAWIRSVFEAEGHQVYVADYEHLGFYCCRAIAPGISEIHAPDDLEWGNNNVVVPWRHTLLNLHAADLEKLQDLADWFDNKHFPAQLLVTELTGIAPDANSPWQALRIGHLRLWLALALEQHQDLKEQCQWAIAFGERNTLDVRLYRCIAALVGLRKHGLDTAHFQRSLNGLYPPELLRLAHSLIDTSVRFPGLHDPGESLDDMKQHQSLIAVFAKLHKAMATYHQDSAG